MTGKLFKVSEACSSVGESNAQVTGSSPVMPQSGESKLFPATVYIEKLWVQNRRLKYMVCEITNSYRRQLGRCAVAVTLNRPWGCKCRQRVQQ